jgi:hypothetical protein
LKSTTSLRTGFSCTAWAIVNQGTLFFEDDLRLAVELGALGPSPGDTVYLRSGPLAIRPAA